MTEHPRDTPQFYLTAPAPCPYLSGREERKVFTHLVGERAAMLNDVLSQGGFRRSQSIAYRPACEGCRACVSVRVCVNDFEEGRSFRRVRKHNEDLVSALLPPTPSSEQYALFQAYVNSRHGSGGMADMSALDYAQMVEDTHVKTYLIEYRKRAASPEGQQAITSQAPSQVSSRKGRGDLIAVALTDILSDGLSMVYSFFNPNAQHRSLGTFLILDHIEKARALNLPYVYLGYWVKGSHKMDYKRRFLPQERLTPQGWERLDKED
ncbi:arginyltransferase [Xanthobacter sp. TB0139]|uniref:arginyltransferase n=1 Tax=Xanthobacter sp. TB0139 TaxID=3459178 RepID=UPI004039750A